MSKPSLLLDSNLFLLLVVGMTDRSLIAKHKRLRQFSSEDFDLLISWTAGAGKIVITPNIATETSNLIDHIGGSARFRIYATLEKLLTGRFGVEVYIESTRAACRKELPSLGITDCGILELCSEGAALLSADLELCSVAESHGWIAVNFHFLRNT